MNWTMETPPPSPATSATERRWLGYALSVGTRPLSAAIQEGLSVGVRRAFRPVRWMALVGLFFAAGGFAMLLFRSPFGLQSDDPLSVFVVCQFAAAVSLAVAIYFLQSAVGLWLRRRRILKQPVVERFEVPPEVLMWMEAARDPEVTCDLYVEGSSEVFVGEGTIAAVDDRPVWCPKQEAVVWVGELPPELVKAGFPGRVRCEAVS